MPKKKKKERTISNHNLTCLEEIAYNLDCKRYLLKLCIDDWNNDDDFDMNAREDFIFVCMNSMVDIRCDLLTLLKCIRSGDDFQM